MYVSPIVFEIFVRKSCLHTQKDTHDVLHCTDNSEEKYISISREVGLIVDEFANRPIEGKQVQVKRE